jgi:hypothetical protein
MDTDERPGTGVDVARGFHRDVVGPLIARALPGRGTRRPGSAPDPTCSAWTTRPAGTTTGAAD